MFDGDRFDDDRLLAYALGLEDDPELRAAVEGSPELAARLSALQAELDHVERGLHELVPPAGPAYERPADEHWRELQPYFTPAEPRRSGRRQLRRVLAPALVVLVVGAAAAGVTATLLSRSGSSSTTSAGSAMNAPESNKATDQSGGALGAGATKSPASVPFVPSSGAAATPLPAATGYEIVAVARAGSFAAGKQTFTVVRALKGSPGKTVVVSVPAAGAVPSGDLRVLYLVPTPPQPAPTATTTYGSPARSAFSYQDEAAQVLPLPPGKSAADVTLP